ncbi:MAG: lysophospholipid acyltransferase family protein, partial [Phycisphaerales bacterium]|nr:lysophospholipid acyltransferase family protein [Phycisphaerales bacterium]
IYRIIRPGLSPQNQFNDAALNHLGVRCSLSEEDIARIPKTGPLIVVANHPFGGLEGMVLASVLRRARPDVKLLANYLLSRIPEMDETSIYVDPFGGADAQRRNMGSMKEALRWLKQGGALGVFPAGEVSSLSLRERRVVDPPWSESVARLAQRSGATVVPLFFEGRNSALFQLAGLAHPLLRTALLPRELLRLRRRTIPTRIGKPISPERIARFDDARELTAYLRLRTYLLRRSPSRSVIRAPRKLAPIATPENPAMIATEIDALPADQTLTRHHEWVVLFASNRQAPTLVREIGRLREVCFRAVGEGSGRAADLDRFDAYYQHLVVWDSANRSVVGAYRLGEVDEIVSRYGIKGLYTNTLFRFRPELIEQISPVLELGRSFVAPQYQRNFASLMLLWRGIGMYVTRKPKYRRLLGAVSISNDYDSMTRKLLVAFMQANRNEPRFGGLLTPRNPVRAQMAPSDRALVALAARDIADVDDLVAEIEHDKTMPVLLRQYLKLNGKMLAFNVDESFGDALDGLVLIDLLDVDEPVLRRYMGEGHDAFIAFHRNRAR